MDSQRSRGGAPAASQASRVFRSQRTARPSRTGLGSRPVLASFQTWAGLMPKSSATSSAEKASFCNSPAQDPWRGLPTVRRLRTVPAVLSLAAVLSVAELACPVGIRLRLDSRMYANRRTKTAKKTLAATTLRSPGQPSQTGPVAWTRRQSTECRQRRHPALPAERRLRAAVAGPRARVAEAGRRQ